MLTRQRYLDNLEAKLKGSAPSFTAEYQGYLDEKALARAFELLCARHPVLSGRIRRDDKGYLLYVPPDHHPRIMAIDGDIRTLWREAHQSWDITRAVAQLTLIREKQRGFVALRADHSIVDGTAVIALFDELWQLYTDVANCLDVSADAKASLPSSPYRALQCRAGVRFSSSLLDATGTPDVTRCKAIERRIHLSEEKTARLIAAARTEHTSVNTLLCGSILVALRAQGRQTERTPMVCWVPIDLRNRVTPPVGATEFTSFSTRHKVEVAVPANGDPIAVGREVKKQLESAIARRELSMEPIQSPPPRVETTLEQRLATVLISNVGVIPKLVRPAELVITDYLIPANPMMVMFPCYAIYTYEGCLNIQVLYPSDFFTNGEVEQLVKRTISQLCEISKCHSA